MGLVTGLLLLPLAPVRATVWLAEQIAEQAEREADPRAALRRELAELQLAWEFGELDQRAYEEAEDALLERLELLSDERGPEGAG
jgi:Gas vesicle protein G